MLSAARKFIFTAYGQAEPAVVPGRPPPPLPMGLPAPLRRKDLDTVWGTGAHYTQYVVSPKADGERVLVGWFRWVGGKTDVGFTADRRGGARKIPWPVHAAAFEGTLLDCELIDQQIWVFDAIMVHGHDLRNAAYHARLVAALTFLTQLGARTAPMEAPPATSVLASHALACAYVCPDDRWSVAVKPIWYHTHVVDAVKWARQIPAFREDGLVYTPVTRSVGVYSCPEVFKWKPLHTVDFLVRAVPDSPGDMELFAVDEAGVLVHFAVVPLRCAHPETPVMPGAVYECAWRDNTWVIERRREDKTLPNARFTADETCKTIAENVRFEDLIPS